MLYDHGYQRCHITIIEGAIWPWLSGMLYGYDYIRDVMWPWLSEMLYNHYYWGYYMIMIIWDAIWPLFSRMLYDHDYLGCYWPWLSEMLYSHYYWGCYMTMIIWDAKWPWLSGLLCDPFINWNTKFHFGLLFSQEEYFQLKFVLKPSVYSPHCDI